MHHLGLELTEASWSTETTTPVSSNASRAAPTAGSLARVEDPGDRRPPPLSARSVSRISVPLAPSGALAAHHGGHRGQPQLERADQRGSSATNGGIGISRPPHGLGHSAQRPTSVSCRVADPLP